MIQEVKSITAMTWFNCTFCRQISFIKIQLLGRPGGSMVEHLPLAGDVIPESWDWVPHRAPCMEPASPSVCVSASLSLFLSLSLSMSIMNIFREPKAKYCYLVKHRRMIVELQNICSWTIIQVHQNLWDAAKAMLKRKEYLLAMMEGQKLMS